MKLKTTAFILAVLLLTSCASIVSKSIYSVSINSNPSEANISITTEKGKEVFNGNTPAVVDLKAGDGFFKKASYSVKFSKSGYEEKVVPIHFKLDGWYWGNIIFGGLIGMLIVDPATGAMYKLDNDFISETLSPQNISADQTRLQIYELNAIPDHWKEHLVVLSE
ncbi:hypothetical protein D1614_12435 [Maribellus luteus]|uniref:PEGA domain-containing protein n=1 Tax=Maribellus luteus TaxID=2305463 RepID=A0A399SWR0_9BACT|nr:hypothetical protein [Maribellus luteus]RIJ47928.1 hypothetical protein D1614_12435 [Maribellus luteus]